MMGDVVTGKYQLSSSAWLMFPARADILGWSPCFYLSSRILAMKYQPEETDFGLYLRPFSITAWIAIVAMTLGMTSIVICKFKWNGSDLNASNGFFIAETSSWYFYLVISAFYGGALTSYFSSKSATDFTSVIDVINAYPGRTFDWDSLFKRWK